MNTKKWKKLCPHMTCHESFLSLASFSLSLILSEMLNIEKGEYKHILNKGPTTSPGHIGVPRDHHLFMSMWLMHVWLTFMSDSTRSFTIDSLRVFPLGSPFLRAHREFRCVPMGPLDSVCSRAR